MGQLEPVVQRGGRHGPILPEGGSADGGPRAHTVVGIPLRKEHLVARNPAFGMARRAMRIAQREKRRAQRREQQAQRKNQARKDEGGQQPRDEGQDQ